MPGVCPGGGAPRHLDLGGVVRAGAAGGGQRRKPGVARLFGETLVAAIRQDLRPLRGDGIRRQAAVDMHQRQQGCGGLTTQVEPATDAEVHGGEGGMGPALMLFALTGDRQTSSRQARKS